MDNINIFGEVSITDKNNNIVFNKQNEITLFGKQYLVTSLFNPRNDKYIDGLSILECANTNILGLNDLETYYNHTILYHSELIDLETYYTKIRILPEEYQSLINDVWVLPPQDQMFSLMLSKSRIVPSSVKLTFTKNTITNEIIDNGRGFLYNKTEYESDVNVQPIGSINYEEGIIYLIKTVFYTDVLHLIDSNLYKNLKLDYRYEQQGIDVYRRYITTRINNWSIKLPNNQSYMPIIRYRTGIDNIRLKYYNEYFRDSELHSIETSQWLNLFNTQIFEHNQFQLVFTFPISTIDNTGFDINQLLLSFGNVNLSLDDLLSTQTSELIYHKVTVSEQTHKSEIDNYILNIMGYDYSALTNPVIRSQAIQYLQIEYDNSELEFKRKLLPFSFIMLDESLHIDNQNGFTLTWAINFRFN